MRRQHTGRAGTVIIPADWDAAPAAIIARTHRSRITIGVSGVDRQFNPARGQSETVRPDPVYDGPATIMLAATTLASAHDQDLVGEEVTATLHQIVLPDPVLGLEVRQTVTVTECSDLNLLGADLTIKTVEYGSRRFSRVLYATIVDPHDPR